MWLANRVTVMMRPDDFGLWNRALSDDDMAQIYALGLNGQSFYTP